ncbi:hypothetical protein GCM10009660_12630 [Catellatospora bangladeshensis]
MLPPESHTACTAGAISAGSPASTAIDAPGPTPPETSAPAIRAARSCTSAQVRWTGAAGSPVVMPRLPEFAAVATIVSTNRLMVDRVERLRAH